MKKLFAIFVSVVLMSQAYAQAQTTTTAPENEQKRALVREILEKQGSLTQVKKISNSMKTMFDQQFLQTVRSNGAHLTAAQQQRVTSVLADIASTEFEQQMADVMPTLLSSIETLYINRFSLEELLELHKFAMSPVAQKSQNVLFNELPALTAPIMGQMSKFGDRMNAKLVAAFAELEKEGISLKRK